MDNGSLRPEATMWLRCLAEGLGDRLRYPVQPVSLLHSSGVHPHLLDDRPAEILEPAVRNRIERGILEIAVLPLFLGPSGALTNYLPKRLARLQAGSPELRITVGEPLVSDANEAILAGILADLAQSAGDPRRDDTAVVLVDHGTPQPAVNEVRNRMAAHLSEELGVPVTASSMERREGPKYDFNEPLLETALRELPSEKKKVIVSMLFLQAGRHAGTGGDVATICETAAQETGRAITIAPLVGEHPRIFAMLEYSAKKLAERAGLPLSRSA